MHGIKVENTNYGESEATRNDSEHCNAFVSTPPHFVSTVLPELQKFKKHLIRQGFLVYVNFEIRPRETCLQAKLGIEYPDDILNVLEVYYDHKNREVTISEKLDQNASDFEYRVSFEDLYMVTNSEVHKIIESFVTAVFTQHSLCEFITEEADAL